MRIVAAGDCLFSSRNLAERLDPKIVSEFKNADAAAANAEFTCPNLENTAPAAGRGYITSVREDTLDEFNDLNIKLVNFANNHTGDFGIGGMTNTIDASRKRGLIPTGVGRSLDEARLPRFVDTPNGRFGIVSAAATRSERFVASNAGGEVIARPGLAPLRWNRSYVLPENLFKDLQKIDEALGTAEAFRVCNEVEVKSPFTDKEFKFGSMFEGSLDIKKGETAHVETTYNKNDAHELLKSVRDASYRSDFNIVSIHTHEGLNNNWYSLIPAEFIQKFAREAIDNGAGAFVGHGAHFMRGVEIYKGKPIFYNLGSLLMEFETGSSIISPEMYTTYGLPTNSRPSDLHRMRANDPTTGEFRGFNGDPMFSRNAIAIFDTDGGKLSFKLLPLDLDMRRVPRMERGVPYIVTPKVGHEIAEFLTKASAQWHTVLTYNERTGYIDITTSQ